MAKKFIKSAIKHPGSLRATAKREGLIQGDETLSGADLDALAAHARKTGDTKTLRRVALARTLMHMKHSRG